MKEVMVRIPLTPDFEWVWARFLRYAEADDSNPTIERAMQEAVAEYVAVVDLVKFAVDFGGVPPRPGWPWKSMIERPAIATEAVIIE